MPKVFLGGVTDKSKWRDSFIPLLKIDYFNPISLVGKKDEAIQKIIQRELCDYYLCVITPRMEWNYTSIAHITEISIRTPNKAIFCYLNLDSGLAFNSKQLFSMKEISHIVTKHGGRSYTSLEDVAYFLNTV